MDELDRLQRELGALREGIEDAREAMRKAFIRLAQIEREADRKAGQLQMES